jgi:hypothetical protein
MAINRTEKLISRKLTGVPPLTLSSVTADKGLELGMTSAISNIRATLGGRDA